MQHIYLDHAATTPVDHRVLEAMQPYFSEKYGNPSSLHFFGQEARKAIDAARDIIATEIGCTSDEVIFVSGGTEANNFVLKGIAFARTQGEIITTPIEHHAILEPLEFLEKRGFRVKILPVDKYGLVDPADVKKAITKETILVSVMHGNNEIGTIEPIREIAEVIRRKTKDEGRNIVFHTDAVQTFGYLPIKVDELNVDLMSVSAHKFYGPKGVGFLYIRKGTRLVRFMDGGAQEFGKRASTQNVPGIVGLGKAVELLSKERSDRVAHVKKLRDKLIAGIQDKIADVVLNGHPEKRLPNNAAFCVTGVEGESMVLNLDMERIAASTGSACSSGSLDPSHVLRAIGVDPVLAHGQVRFTLGNMNTEAEVDKVLEILPRIVEKLRRMSPLYKAK